MEKILEVLEQIWALLNEMSPYLLLGFLLAGLMHAFIPGTLYSRYLSKPNFRSVLYAALFGVPLPLCSCGVIPTAMSLRKEGASKGSTVSFLIATPQTGVDSIIATLSLMGLPFAVIRPISALFTAIFGGQLVNAVEGKEGSEGKSSSAASQGNIASSEGTGTAARNAAAAEQCCTAARKAEAVGQCCATAQGTDSAGKCCADGAKKKAGFVEKVREALTYAFVEMMEDIGKWLVVGLIVAGLITILVPDSFFAIFKGNTFLSMLLVLCIAVPMYICATGSIPIAVALMMKGLTPGSALVLLMAGPACNVASMLVIGKVLGRRTLVAYLTSIIAGSVFFGAFIDAFLPAEWFLPTLMPAEGCCHEAHGSWFSSCCTVLLLLLLLNALYHRFCGHGRCHCHEQSHHAAGVEEARKTREFGIKGMNCSHCCANAQKALESIPGVVSARVDLSTGRAVVEGDISLSQAEEALAALGFTVVA